MVRGRGYIRGIKDLEQIVLKSTAGTPVYLRDVARVELAPDERRGITELNGEGEVVAGIAVQRYGQNALTVIDNIKRTLRGDQIEPARGHRDYSRLRPLRAHQTGNRDLEADAH